MSSTCTPSQAHRQADVTPFTANPAWQALPYRSVLVQFPDGSLFYLRAEALAQEAAKQVALPGISTDTHLQRQIIPLITETPTVLLDIARRLSWAAMLDMACRPFWRTPAVMLAPRVKQAHLSLQTLRD